MPFGRTTNLTINYQQFDYFKTNLEFPQKNYKLDRLYQSGKIKYNLLHFIGILQKLIEEI